jgi:hypothetical protein
MDSGMVEDVTKALERFVGREVKVTVEVFNGKKPKVQPPNNHSSKQAPLGESEFHGEEVT